MKKRDPEISRCADFVWAEGRLFVSHKRMDLKNDVDADFFGIRRPDKNLI